jgi:hypothetical protein
MGRSTIAGIPDEDYIEDPLEHMAGYAQTYLRLDQWRFKESFRRFKSYFDAELIYNSDICRIRLGWGWDRDSGNLIFISYGRLHAPNYETKMEWNGEKRDAWHSYTNPLFFLDGIMTNSFAVHPILKKFRQSEGYRNLASNRTGKVNLVFHSFIWEYYTPRLFELFDLRRPKLWEEYRTFLHECYVAENRNEELDEKQHGKTPYYRVC